MLRKCSDDIVNATAFHIYFRADSGLTTLSKEMRFRTLGYDIDYVVFKESHAGFANPG